MITTIILISVLSFIVAIALGGVAGYFIRGKITKDSLIAAEKAAGQQLKRAEARSKEILIAAKEKRLQINSGHESEIRKSRQELRQFENKITAQDNQLRQRSTLLEKKGKDIEKIQKELMIKHREADKIISNELERLEKISNLRYDEAHELIMKRTQEDAKFQIARRYRDIENEAKHTADQKARTILAESLQRLATDIVFERTTSSVLIPGDDMKGRLIGREGRNIRSIEAVTGVDLIIEDSSDMVTISCFDPIRREVARVALEWLVKDGRIQPARIEEMVARAQKQINDDLGRASQEALFETGIKTLHPELMKLMGRLKFRYSYGGNVLQHSIEVGLLSAMLAAEIGADIATARMAGFLHDIGKALTHEVEGPHAEIGANLVAKYGIPKRIELPIREHHDSEMTSPESFIVAAADALSAARPGARKDTTEKYVARLEALEEVARSFEGVERCFAIQAGREIRVMVNPDGVDDLMAASLARDIVARIEDTLAFPGQIKVVVIRERRAVEIAS